MKTEVGAEAASTATAAAAIAPLAAGEISLSTCVIGKPRAADFALLSPDELTRVARFRAQAPHDAFIAGRVLLRRALSGVAQVAPHLWRFAADDNGRPFIAEPRIASPLYFSLSHTEGRAACVVARTPRIGVDIEPLARAVSFNAVRHLLAPAEIAMVEAASATTRAKLLLRLWTLKEAYGKALGVGITSALREAVFEFGGLHPELQLARANRGRTAAGDERWVLRQFVIGGTHLCAIAVQGRQVERIRSAQ